MIQKSYIMEWRDYAPWLYDEMVEQDLVLSRIIVELFNDAWLAENLAFRGGTALQKIYFDKKFRYSEDIDLVQIQAVPIGELVNRIREKLDGWLEKPTWKQNEGRFTLYYKFFAEIEPFLPMRVKIEINTREHFSVMGYVKKIFTMNNGWFTGKANITTYELEELLGTKLRALFQRKKGRDVLDLGVCLSNFNLNTGKILECFEKYVSFVGSKTTRAQFEQNLYEKCEDKRFLSDTNALLPEKTEFGKDLKKFIRLIHKDLVSKIPGDSWRGLPKDFFC